MQKLRKALDIRKGFVGLISGPKLNLIMTSLAVIVEDLLRECNCYGRPRRGKWREMYIFRRRKEREELKRGHSWHEHTHSLD